MATRIPASRRTREGLPPLIEGHFPQLPQRTSWSSLQPGRRACDAVWREYYEHSALPGQGRDGSPYRPTERDRRADGIFGAHIAVWDELFEATYQGLDLAIEM